MRKLVYSLSGLILAAGFSGHGFGIGPGSGHLIADIITGSEPIVDPRLPARETEHGCMGQGC